MRKFGRRLGWAAPLALVFLALGYAALRPSWEPPARTSLSPLTALGESQVRAVTLNAYKLRQAERIPRLFDALRTTARQLAATPEGLPELIALQEVQSRFARDALVTGLEPTHLVIACDCAEGQTSAESGVVLAASRDRFQRIAQRCIALDSTWPGPARCAAELTLEDSRGQPVTALTVHLPWRPDNRDMVERLRDRARPTGRTVWLGDFNASPDSAAYALLSAPPLRDARSDGPPTHYLGRRIDMVLVSPELAVAHTLDRRASFDALRPSASHRWPGLPYGWADRHCETDPGRCPVSDHLPEGVVLDLW